MAFLPEMKSRTEPTGPYLYSYTRFLQNLPWTESVHWSSVTETIISQCHKGTWPPPYGSKDDRGGLMSLTRQETSYPQYVEITSPFVKGKVLLLSTNLFHPMGSSSVAPTDISVLNAFGTSAIARVLPTNPNSSLSTALGELKKDGLPSLPGSSMREQTNIARRAGNEFLNAEFGWLPLVNDIKAFADSVKRSKQLIDQYMRDSDRKIRRRFTPAPINHSVRTFVGPGQCTGGNTVNNTTITETSHERYWFSGAFRYHVPVGDDFYSRLVRYEQLSHRLFDTRLTPELLWNLAPWSWAIDWFTNAGDVIHNISSLGADGLVMQYGYAMRHAYIDELASGRFTITEGAGRWSGWISKRVLSETKYRAKAHPYGFGIDDLSLSAIQYAILAALGLTRGHRSTM